MKFTIFGLMLFLAACNGSTSSAPDPEIAALKSQVQNLTEALAAATHADAQKFANLQIIGQVRGPLSMDAGRAITASFGPCASMGVYQGQGGSDSANPLHSQFEIYKQIADATTGCPASTTSYNEVTGLHDRLLYAAWDGPNCTGTLYVETDVPQNTMSLAALENILLMMSPDPADSTVYASAAGSTPQAIQIQSSYNAAGGECLADIETRMVIPMVVNDVQVTGVPDSLVPGSWSKVSP